MCHMAHQESAAKSEPGSRCIATTPMEEHAGIHHTRGPAL